METGRDEWLAVDGKEHVTPAISRMADDVIVKAKGSWVETAGGKKLLDFTAGIGVTNTGHCHPHVVKAIQEQAENVLHVQVNLFWHDQMLRLVHELLPVMPDPSLDTFFFWNSGAEAVEAAVKLARHATGRPNIVVVQGSYHGRTIGTMAMTTSKYIYRGGFGPLMPGVFVTPFPYASQLPKGLTEDQMVQYCLDQLEMLLRQQTMPAETACLVIEPILGEGGYVPAPKAYMQGLQCICKANDILLVVDEVQTGFGRTGKMFAVEHVDIVPDILVMAKGLASGLPLSAIVSRKELMAKQPPGSMGGTYAGNVVSCAAAVATLEVLKKENLLDNSVQRGHQLSSGLRRLQQLYPIRDIRGPGLMVGMEFDGPKGVAAKLCKACFERGLVILTASVFENIRFIPPLTVSAEEVDQCLSILESAMKEVFA